MIAWDTPVGIIDRGRLALIIVYRETRLIIGTGKGHSVREMYKSC